MARISVNFLLSEAGVTWLDSVAEKHPGTTRSDVIRIALAVARKDEGLVHRLLEDLG